jgi:hypothetical protein
MSCSTILARRMPAVRTIVQFTMLYERQAGFVVGAVLDVITKEVPVVLAVIVYVLPVVVLHVTPRRDPMLESSAMTISLFAVTAVVLTVTVVAAAAIVTAPAGAAPHVPPVDVQFVTVENRLPLIFPVAALMLAVLIAWFPE